MSRLRKRLWEMTTSAAVPNVVRPFAMIRKVRPNLIAINKDLRKKKKRLVKRSSKFFSPPMQIRI